MTVLQVRARPDLLAAIDERASVEMREHPGRYVSRSDVVREILWSVLLSDKVKQPKRRRP